ncbi:PREDICTED: probable root meristem growth factor 8 isoform X2 [Tarenaya hassleriana]|uniref:probable root meristem growth factor 8 isoform X2 n=1 Tax=Tarenaya hassleriana TaxID=28532 RepID=UPI00053C1867|nr:PREDICTED: probable root meristem growth factor 8 isoform X2 [Tarenaya hassleriana]
MKLRFTAMLCVLAILFLLTPVSSLRLILQSSNERGLGQESVNVKVAPPRNLMFDEEVLTAGEPTHPPSSHHSNGVTSSGKNKGKQKQLSREEGGGEIDPSQYLSMDYPRRKRRRPVHNKSLPLGP